MVREAAGRRKILNVIGWTRFPVVTGLMVGIGALALAANTVCFGLLWRHRTSDINLRSTWLCSRNDLVANSAVIIAAVLVARFQSVWPDVLVGVGIAARWC